MFSPEFVVDVAGAQRGTDGPVLFEITNSRIVPTDHLLGADFE
jgi:hypothetical protein